MTLRTTLAALLACCALAVPAFAAEAPATFTETLGGMMITLPRPEGLGAPSATPQAVRDLITRSVPPMYRFIGMQMAQDDLDLLGLGKHLPRAQRYAILLTYRDYEDAGMAADLFAQVKVVMRQQGERIMKEATAKAAPIVDHMAKDVAKVTGDKSISMTLGSASSLGVFDERPDSISLATVSPMTMTDKDGTQNFTQVMAMAVVRIHGKPIGFHVYSDFNSQADVDWAEGQVRDWVRRVVELNP